MEVGGISMLRVKRKGTSIVMPVYCRVSVCTSLIALVGLSTLEMPITFLKSTVPFSCTTSLYPLHVASVLDSVLESHSLEVCLCLFMLTPVAFIVAAIHGQGQPMALSDS